MEDKLKMATITSKVFSNKRNKQLSLAIPKKKLPKTMKRKPIKKIKFKIIKVEW